MLPHRNKASKSIASPTRRSSNAVIEAAQTPPRYPQAPGATPPRHPVQCDRPPPPGCDAASTRAPPRIRPFSSC
ncbi:hypothetical protein IMZ48_30160 [Candidatus Bathyarchaeota archaeon]|nr:hypothetical protein [Candidatus Bathyarchaeota archaeon]